MMTMTREVVGLEEVTMVHDPEPLERGIETRVRIAIAAAGVLVMKHRVEVCPHCGGRPKKGQGLGLGATDLLCIVPPYGRACFIEMKRPSTRSRTSCEQKAFLAVVRRFKAVSGVATNEAEALALVDLARRLP